MDFQYLINVSHQTYVSQTLRKTGKICYVELFYLRIYFSRIYINNNNGFIVILINCIAFIEERRYFHLKVSFYIRYISLAQLNINLRLYHNSKERMNSKDIT